MNPTTVDAIVDLTYGALIALAIVLIVTVDTNMGISFAVGVFAAYAVHVFWKMVRFDPDWMTTAVQETVEETVETTVEETVGETVETTVDEAIETTVTEEVRKLQEQVEAVDERIDRWLREDKEPVDEDEDSDSEG